MKPNKIIAIVATFVIAFLLAVDIAVQAATDNSVQTETTVIKAADMTPGEVRKIDKEAGKLTLKHSRIENLDMPGMTMVFQVKDKSLLDKIQVGDKVKFKAISENGKLTVTDIKADK